MKVRPQKRKNFIKGKSGIAPAPRTKRAIPIMDSMWFLDQLDRVKKSQAQVGREIGIDPTNFNRRLKGTRTFRPAELLALARVLNVPHGEVLKALGLEPGMGPSVVPVSGHINGELQVVLGAGLEGPRKAPAPTDIPGGAVALRYQTTGSKLDFTNGWLLYYAPTTHVQPEAVGRLAVVQVVDRAGPRYVRVLKRNYEGGYTLIDPAGVAEDISGLRVINAAPVLWIKT